MLEKSKLNIIFILVALVSVSLLIYIGVNIAEKIHDTKGALRLLSAGLIPIPIAIYTGFLFNPALKRDIITKDQNIKPAIALFLGSFIFIMLFIYLFEYTTGKVFENHMLPFVLNSTIIVFYTINYMTKNSFKLAGILSGTLFGMALYIFLF